MRAVVQRVSRAEVRVEGQVVGKIGAGILVLVGIGLNDTPETARALAEKVMNLRILNDDQGRLNRSVLEAQGGVLCVSQFTLYGDARRGRRPSYIGAASPASAQPLYEKFLEEVRALAAPHGLAVESGCFQAMMEVELINDGPVTILLDTDRIF